MAWLGVTNALWTTVRNIFRPQFTVEYPAQQRQRPERFRASFALLHDEQGEESCVACLLCEKACPSGVIKIKAGPKRESPATGKKRQYLEDFTLDLTACMQCELCVQVCPQDALVMVNRPEAPGYCREDLLLTKDRLFANEKAVPLAWANATRLLQMQEPPKPAPAPAAASAAASTPVAAPAAAAPVAVAPRGAQS